VAVQSAIPEMIFHGWPLLTDWTARKPLSGLRQGSQSCYPQLRPCLGSASGRQNRADAPVASKEATPGLLPDWERQNCSTFLKHWITGIEQNRDVFCDGDVAQRYKRSPRCFGNETARKDRRIGVGEPGNRLLTVRVQLTLLHIATI
jgi:hypothetical protein